MSGQAPFTVKTLVKSYSQKSDYPQGILLIQKHNYCFFLDIWGFNVCSLLKFVVCGRTANAHYPTEHVTWILVLSVQSHMV